MCKIFAASKLIYLTNAISLDDVKRCQKNNYGRYAYLYDCSIGGLISSDARIDVNGEVHRDKGDFSELETYFQYEKYKQIKFVFDKKQYQILQDMKDNHYPVPVPQKLYIDLLLDSQLGQFLGDFDISKRIEEVCFPRKQSIASFKVLMEISNAGNEEIHKSGLLQYFFCRSCLWGMLRSIFRRMNSNQQDIFSNELKQCLKQIGSEKRKFHEISDMIWQICEQICFTGSEASVNMWHEFIDECKPCYNIFIQYIEKEADLANHIVIESSIDQIWNSIKQEGSIRLSVSTTEHPEWFIDFIKKYRYAANPDYFLNFDWGLSSGENNLLSTFASFYYIFGADYTNEKNGEYTIYNCTKEKNGENVIAKEDEAEQITKCDNIILLISQGLIPRSSAA